MVDKMSDGLLNIVEHKIISNLSQLKNLNFNGKLEEKIE